MTSYDARTQYERHALERDQLDADPVLQLDRWIADAAAAAVHEPHAMVLATVGVDGRPHARVVLCRGAGADGLRFYSNYESAKGRQLAARAWASALFFWPALERQVRVEGAIEKLSSEDSAAYFASRPRESQLGAWASPQSEPLPDRQTLLDRLAEVTARFDGRDVPLPPFWGGYRLLPDRFEFWQGRTSRLHDRFCYQLTAGQYAITRLAP